ncbi:MAG: trypsin-like serine protease [Sphingopyxis sp.]
MANRKITIECTPGLPWIGLFFGHLWTSRNNSTDGYDVRKRLRQSSGMQTDSVSPLSMPLRSTLFATMILACTNAFAAPAPAHGDTQHRAMAIVGGQKVADFAKETPWHVGLLNTSKDQPECGGTLIAADLVLTAAHCLDGHRLPDISIRYGSTNWQDGSMVDVLNAEQHPSWRDGANTDRHDLALVRIGKLQDVEPMELANAALAAGLEAGSPGQIAGWGGSTGINYAVFLRTATVSTLPPGENCPQEANGERWLLCSSSVGQAPPMAAEICYGDSGGGLIVGHFLVGVIRGVMKDKVKCELSRKQPSVYTSIVPALSWVHETSARLRSQPVAAPKLNQGK